MTVKSLKVNTSTSPLRNTQLINEIYEKVLLFNLKVSHLYLDN